MKKTVSVIAALLVLGGATAWAQSPPSGRFEPPPRGDSPSGPAMNRAIEEHFIAPELVMRNQATIGLTESQQQAIRAEMQKAMGQFTDLQWQQSAKADQLAALYRRHPVDEKEVLAHFEKLLELESEIKRLRLVSLIRIKNILTPEQQAKLRELERQGRPAFDEAPRRFGAGPKAGGPPPGAPGR